MFFLTKKIMYFRIRDGVIQLMDKYYPNEDRRPIILPIEWRSSLTLDNNLTDVVTLPRMPSMRNTLNSVAMDIMYYQSPLYRTEVVIYIHIISN